MKMITVVTVKLEIVINCLMTGFWDTLISLSIRKCEWFNIEFLNSQGNRLGSHNSIK